MIFCSYLTVWGTTYPKVSFVFWFFHIFSHWFQLTIILGFITKSKHKMVLSVHIIYSELPIYSKTKLIFFSTQLIRKNWLKLHNIVRNLNIRLSKSMYSILEAIYWTLWSSAYHTHLYSEGPTIKHWPRDWLSWQVFRDFLTPFPDNAMTVPQIRRSMLLFTSFYTHIITWSFNSK